MALTLLVLLSGSCFIAVSGYQRLPLELEEIQAVQERLARFEGMEKAYESIMAPQEKREEDQTCLPEGAGCSFASGPNCCGVRMRCIVFDTQVPQRGGPAKWLSRCREYKGGVVADSVADFFKNMG